jgi:predicted 3-demethylubiquinone-9 3-methyltransferase (glyoxalase superfamily)
MGPRYSTCLWFDGQAQEAATFYAALLDDAEITDVVRPDPDAPAMTVSFRLGSQEFLALNGPTAPAFTPATSIVVRCADQAQVDRYWDALTAGGEPGRCGWCIDRFGVSWQVVPDRLIELLSQPDPEAGQRVMQAMLAMDKIVIADLEAALQGTG